MKKLLIFLGALAAYGTDCTISDTVRTPFGGYFAGRIVVALNSPASAQPLYSGSQTLTGWQTTIEVPSTANGVVAFTLVCTDTITPSGTSYSARYQPTSGSGWAETWSPATGTTTIRSMRATTVPTPTTTFQSSQLALSAGSMVYGSSAGVGTALAAGSNGQVLALSGGYPAWTTNIAGNAGTATALQTARTIAGVSFNGTANISIASTNLSDTANIVRNNASTTYTAGSKQTFAHSATTAGLNVGVQAAAPSSPAQGDVFFNTTLTRKGVYDGTQWRYELYAPSSGTGVVSWDGTSLSASTTLAGLSSVTSTSFTGALTGNASTATALASALTSGRVLLGDGTGTPATDSGLTFNTTTDALTVGGNLLLSTDGSAFLATAGTTYFQPASGNTELTFQMKPLGTATASRLRLHGQLSTSVGTRADFEQSGANTFIRNQTLGGGSQGYITFDHDGTTRLRISTAGNVLAGTTTDLGYGLHAANKGTNGNFLCYDPTATTGTTKCVARAGAGQSGNIFEVQNSAGAALASIASTGFVSTPQVYLTGDWLNLTSTTADMASGYLLRFSSTAAQGGTKDLSLSRASAGVLQVGDGGANANGYLTAARIGVGTASPLSLLHVESTGGALARFAYNSTYYLAMNENSIDVYGGNQLAFKLAGSEKARIAATSGNLLIGGTTDGNYKLDVQNSGSSGTLRVYDQTATTGNTKEVIRAGAGQSTNLTEWQNNAGTVLGSISLLGVGTFQDVISNGSVQATADFIVANGSQYRFNTRGKLYAQSDGVFTIWDHAQTSFNRLQFGGSTSSFPSLKRSSAILQARLADDSAYTQIQASRFISDQTTPAASTDACTAGALWADATYIYACTASGTIKRATLATF